MKIFTLNILLCVLLLVSSGVGAQLSSGREIIQKVKDRPDGNTRYCEMTMKLINKNGNERERKVISCSIDAGNDKKDVKTLMFFTYPGDVKGTGFLTWDYNEIGKDDDKWLYLPAMKKTRRISGSSAKKDYFMGTDFTYDDLGSRNVDEDTHKLLKEETINNEKCWVVESISKDDRDIYSKKISWISKDKSMILKVNYFDNTGNLHRELEISDIKEVDGFLIAKTMHMTNVQTNHETIISVENPKFNINIDESSFNTSKLELGGI